MLKKWIANLPQRLRLKKKRQTINTSFLCSESHLFSLLESERMRADRTGAILTLVVFELPKLNLQKKETADFLERLEQRIRATDHVGHFGTHGQLMKIGVILWDTDLVGSQNFVKDVVEKIDEQIFPNCEFYVYPTEKDEFASSRSRKNDQRKTTTKKIGTEPIMKYEVPVQQTETVQKNGTNEPFFQKITIHHSVENSIPKAQSLEKFFIKPLPLWKRSFDIAASIVGLIVFSPLLCFVALLIKLTSRGPILFVQQRSGLGGKSFPIYKFRTMQRDAESQKAALRQHSEQDGPAFKIANDPRITTIGRYLRKSCLDELPQLLNILKGDMTVVGPRPLPVDEAEAIVSWGQRRLEITPGLTCIWQVHGKSKVTFLEWMRMDIRYMKIRTFFQDIKLIGKTVTAVIMHRASH